MTVSSWPVFWISPFMERLVNQECVSWYAPGGRSVQFLFAERRGMVVAADAGSLASEGKVRRTFLPSFFTAAKRQRLIAISHSALWRGIRIRRHDKLDHLGRAFLQMREMISG